MVYINRYLLLIFITPLFFSACVTMRSVPIETMQPAKFSFQSPKNKIAICASQTVLSEAITSNEGTRGISTDSLIANVLFSLQHSLEDAHGYENTNFTTFIIKTGEAPPIYSDFDMVIEMNMLQITLYYYIQQYGYYEWEAYMYALYVAKWQIRNNTGALIDEYIDDNTMLFPSGIYAERLEAVENMPYIKDTWWDVGIAVAQRYANHIAPQWQKGKRNIYMIDKFPELSMMAYKAMQNDAFGRAFDIWETMLFSCRKRGQKTAKSQIIYNMAVACEFQNQLEEAVNLAQKSANMKRNYRTTYYINTLNGRQKHKIELDRQTLNLKSET